MAAVNVSLIQTDLVWENPAANREKLETIIASLQGKTHIVLLPEMFTTGFTMNPEPFAETANGETVSWLIALANKYTLVIGGSMILTSENGYTNTFVWAQPNYQISFYNKKHLFAYAGEHKHYTPGQQRVITSINGIRFSLNICYDLRFPVWSRYHATQNPYHVLVYVANWPHKRVQAWQTLLQARAIENQCYVLGLNRVGTDGNGHIYTGNSMIITPMGQVLHNVADAEAVLTHTIELKEIEEVRTQLPFLTDADDYLIPSTHD
ncbi:MAG: amidohydrolase [Bacteroidetes bacterium]|nr:MAG: amidohydrolase [Bacteroidota bacterium]TAE70071.1 MAG: amidohydrolase [Bacteroidota bacterium]TAF93406.1 MAG: amidohydrolase [Bacteroidota bacterium]